MSQKIKYFPKNKSKKIQYSNRQKQKDPDSKKAEDLILAYLYDSSAPLLFTELYNHLAVGKFKKKDINLALEFLLHNRLICQDKKKRFKLCKTASLYEGTLVQHPRGFGFVKPVGLSQDGPTPIKDPFISPARMGTAYHGDKVLIRMLRSQRNNRPEASVIKILCRGSDRIGGIFVKDGQEQLVYPDDPKFPFKIKIVDNNGLQPKHGETIIVQFIRTGKTNKFLPGKIIEILGSNNNIDTQLRLIVERFNLPSQFSDEVLQEAARLTKTCTAQQNRHDLRTIPHVTIDGESAKDFDDAICVVKTTKGFRLYVSIADVSHFVKPGSAIDQEAYARGTSIYFPGRVIPMLPEELSNDLCSLLPDRDRFTLSAILDFDGAGTVIKKHFCKSLIRSTHRFTYDVVNKILHAKDQDVGKKHKPFIGQLKIARELALILQQKRKKRGAIDFNIAEAEFILNNSGEMSSIKRMERNFAHQMIEEFMLAANEVVATFFTEQSIPAIFRVHEPPNHIKAEEFTAFVKTLDLPFTTFTNQPSWFAGVLDSCRGTKYEYIINNLVLRSMSQAYYSAKNLGHFGLAAPYYTHFTSPIRRYPDLIVHRILTASILNGCEKDHPDHCQTSLKKSCEQLSGLEKNAVKAERDLKERLRLNYIKDKIGASFDAIISGVTENALYIEIQNLYISGSIDLGSIDDDYYIFDGKNHRIVGEISTKTYQLGDEVRVTLSKVDIYKKKIHFILGG